MLKDGWASFVSSCLEQKFSNVVMDAWDCFHNPVRVHEGKTVFKTMPKCYLPLLSLPHKWTVFAESRLGAITAM